MKLGRSIAVIAGLTIVGSMAQSAMAAITIQASAVPFVDISVTGTSVIPPGALGDDNEYIITSAALTGAGFTGNGLLAGGVNINVGNNGAVIWNPVVLANGTGGTGDQVGWTNSTTLGTMAAVNSAQFGNGNGARQFIAPLWDDTTPGASASVRWQVIGGNLIIQWTNQDHFNATGSGTVSFQMVVNGGVAINSGLSLVDFVYNDTLYAASQYQNDGGSATIGYKNWGVNGLANDVEFGIGGGVNTTADPTFAAGTNMQPKVGGWAASNDANLPHSVSIVPEPATLSLLAFGAIALIRRRR